MPRSSDASAKASPSAGSARSTAGTSGLPHDDALTGVRRGASGSPGWSHQRVRDTGAPDRSGRWDPRRAEEATRGRWRQRRTCRQPGGEPLIVRRHRHRSRPEVPLPFRRSRLLRGRGLPCVGPLQPARRRRPQPWRRVQLCLAQLHPPLRPGVAAPRRHRGRLRRTLALGRWQLELWCLRERRSHRCSGRVRHSRPPTPPRGGDRRRRASAATDPPQGAYVRAGDAWPRAMPAQVPLNAGI